MRVWQELGISGGTAVLVLFALYFIVKWAVKNGIKEAHREIAETENDETPCAAKKQKESTVDIESNQK